MEQAEESFKNLSEIGKSTLVALVDACSHSVNAHPPVEAVSSKFPTHLRGEIKGEIKNLVRKELAYLHPTGNSRTYGVTKLGLDVYALIIKDC